MHLLSGRLRIIKLSEAGIGALVVHTPDVTNTTCRCAAYVHAMIESNIQDTHGVLLATSFARLIDSLLMNS
jgi:hypothetical protein